MELIDIEKNEIITSKLKQVPEKVEQITGLDFHRFCRSILLAQGNFAAFLTANDDERAVLLEKITGTRIYSVISEKTYDKKKEEENKLLDIRKILAGYNLFSDDKLLEIKQNILAAEKELAQAENQKQGIIRQKTYLETVEGCKQKSVLYETGLQTLVIEEKNAAPDLERLQTGYKAAPLAGEYEQLKALKKTCVTLENRINSICRTVPELEQELEDAKKKHASDHETHKDLCGNAEKKLALIVGIEKYLPLIRERSETVQQLAADRDIKQKELTKILSEKEKLKKRLEQKQKAFQETEKELEKSDTEINALQKNLKHLLNDQTEEDFQTRFTVLERKKRLLEKQKEKSEDIFERTEKINSITSSIKKVTKQLESSGKQDALLEPRETALLKKRRDLKKALELEIKIKNLDDMRKELIPDTPCPLCGSAAHPFSDSLPKTGTASAMIETNEKDLADLAMDRQKLQTLIIELSSTVTHSNLRINEEKACIEKSHDKCRKISRETGIPGIPTRIKTLETAVKEIEDKLLQTRTSIKELSILKKTIATARDRIQELKEKKAGAELDCGKAETHAETLKKQSRYLEKELHALDELFTRQENSLVSLVEECRSNSANTLQASDLKADLDSGSIRKHPESLEKDLGRLRQDLNRQVKTGENNLLELAKSISSNQALIAAKKNELERAQKDLKTAIEKKTKNSASFTEAMIQAGFKDQEEYLRAKLTPAIQKRLELIKKKLSKKRIEHETLKKSNDDKLNRLLSDPTTLETMDSLIKIETGLETGINELSKTVHKLEFELEENRKRRMEHLETVEEEKKQQDELRRWDGLNQLIGQKDGGKFRKFAQGLTLERLMVKANTYLAMLNQRYFLKKNQNRDLGITVIDTFFGDRIRPTENLSGGESFLVSLSLALGLSDLTSRQTTIESLFLDEGFGTLDTETLEIALSALDALNASGKTIGIISHVDALKERIAAKIEVKPTSGGTSRIKINTIDFSGKEL